MEMKAHENGINVLFIESLQILHNSDAIYDHLNRAGFNEKINQIQFRRHFETVYEISALDTGLEQ